jgi:spermidine/putrescine transport system ATP-binding protein
MNAGRIEQLDDAAELYERPRTRFVAQFLGSCNLIEAAVDRRNGDTFTARTELGPLCVPASAPGASPVKVQPGDRLTLAIRPEKIEVFKAGDPLGGVEASNLVSGRIEVVIFLGAAVRLVVNVDGEEVISDVVEKTFEQRQLRAGQDVLLYFPPEAFLVYPLDEASS